MSAPAKPRLARGRVYRTRQLAQWSENPTRLAKRLVREGHLRQLANGLYYRPHESRFGEVPPSDEALMRGFLEGSAFVFTGPEYWNSLGLGSTALSPETLVYNTKRSGPFQFGSRRFRLRRMRFPRTPPPEWYAVDLLDNGDYMDLESRELLERLRVRLNDGGLKPSTLESMARKFGTKRTQQLVRGVTTRLAA